MEEIEYLEEYEDLILPNATNCTEELSDRRSVDSLEGLYKDLIDDSSGGSPGLNDISQTPTKTIANIDTASTRKTVDDGLLAKSFQNQKSNTNSASIAYRNATNTSTSEVQQPLFKNQTSHISFLQRASNPNFSTCPPIQRTDKLKSVATVKPTLQRVSNTVKHCMRNITPPVKTTKEQSYQPSPFYTSKVSTETRYPVESKVNVNDPKANGQTKNSIKIAYQFQGNVIDPLSLDDRDAFLDFDVDKNGSVDGCDFESDLDHSITAGITDMDSDSVDLSDEYSDGNFDLESDLSSEASDVKKTLLLKRKRLQESNLEENTEKLKNKAGPSSTKPENKWDQTHPIKVQRLNILNVAKGQQFAPSSKMVDAKKTSSHLSFGERKINANRKKCQILNRNKRIIRKLREKSKRSLFSERTSKLSHIEKSSTVVSNSNRTEMTPNRKKFVAKKDERPRNYPFKPSSAARTDKRCSKKQLGTISKYANGETIKNVEDKLNVNSIPPDDKIKIKSREPSLPKSSPPNPIQIEKSIHKNDATPDKNVRMKLGSQYLRSIKPPISKGLLLNKISQNHISSSEQQAHQSKTNPESKDKNISKETSPKEHNNIPSVQNNKSVQSDVQKKVLSLQKSPVLLADDKAHIEIEVIQEVKSNDSSDKNPFKEQMNSNVVKTNFTEKQSKKDIPEKSSEELVHTTNCSTDTLLENNTLTASIKKIQPKDNKIDNVKVNKLQYKFQARSFSIRLNRNIIEQFLRSSTNQNGSRASKVQKHESKNTLKRKKLGSKKRDRSTTTSKTCSESGQEKIINKPQSNTKTETNTSKMGSCVFSNTLEKQAEREIEEKGNTKKETSSTSRKRRKRKTEQMTLNKTLRSSSKLMSQIPCPQPTSNNVNGLEMGSVVDECNTQKSPRIVTGVELSPSSNSTPTKVEQNKKKVGRPRLNMNLRTTTLTNKLKDVNQSSNGFVCPVLLSRKEKGSNGEKESSSTPTPIVIDGLIRNENIVSVSLPQHNTEPNPEVQIVQPKTELYGDTIIYQYQTGLMLKDGLSAKIKNCENSNTLDGRNQVYSSKSSGTEFLVFGLPSYIVMKTKIITREELHNSKPSIPPMVKHKINKLTEERQIIPMIKPERPEFKDVCLEINTLLGRNANYLKFASVSERQFRMNQVLSDCSLSTQDAQCALKFLQSYFSLGCTKEIRVKSKGQQVVPIYDSQKQIIGYRKRTMHSKRPFLSNDNNKTSALTQKSDLNVHTPSSAPTKMNAVSLSSTYALSGSSLISTKKEPPQIDASDEEIIVPDAAPANDHCVKSEDDHIKEIT